MLLLSIFFQQNDRVSLTESNLLLANELQRVAISMVAKHLFHIAKPVDDCSSCEPQISMLLGGTAGTGKTFVLNAINRISQRLFKRNGAVLNLAPTGAASVLIPNGRTIHSVIPMPRKKKKKDQLTTQLCDHPMSDNNRNKLRRYTGTSEDERKIQALIVDERSQIPHDIIAWISHRMSEALKDDSEFGGTPFALFSGDNGQLGPIGSVDLHLKPKKPSTPIEDKGCALYQSFDNVIILDQTMRQGPDQLEFLKLLLRIRSGEITQSDLQSINSRYEGNLSLE